MIVGYGFDSDDETEDVEEKVPKKESGGSQPAMMPGAAVIMGQSQSSLPSTSMVAGDQSDASSFSPVMSSEEEDAAPPPQHSASEPSNKNERLGPEVPSGVPPVGIPDPKTVKRVNELLTLKRRGKTINKLIRSSSEFANPYMLQRIMKFFEIDPDSTMFPPSFFNPAKVVADNEYYDALAKAQEDASKQPLAPGL